jgi:cyclopropane fatty-acyl-phospholipid synthase-like methyltransferase
MRCAGIHRAVIKHLLDEPNGMLEKRILDIRCGNADLMRALREFFPSADIRGCDVAQPSAATERDFTRVDADQPFDVLGERKFDCILSINDVMESGTLRFLQRCNAHLNADGLLVVSNGNIVALHERIRRSFLSGRHRWAPLFVDRDTSRCHAMPMHQLIRGLGAAGFRIREVRYVFAGPKDWLLLPIAWIIYPMQLLHVRWTRNPMALWQKRRMYSFRSLLCSHYLVICDKSLG